MPEKIKVVIGVKSEQCKGCTHSSRIYVSGGEYLIGEYYCELYPNDCEYEQYKEEEER